VTWFYDEVRRWLGHDVRVCASGWSSGGHLALLLAALRPSLDCAIAQAAPTDLPALRAGDTIGGAAAEFAFGPGATSPPADEFSPVTQADGIRAALLLATAANDTWVPASQMDAMRDAMAAAGRARQITTLRLPEGTRPFFHGTVSAAAIDRLHRAEERFAEGVLARGR
jgi:dipeptidyl aminopeptidase/acylaminoacyl peptidase